MICPKCKTETLFDQGFYWLTEEEREPAEDDMLLRCARCWEQFTMAYLKEVNVH